MEYPKWYIEKLAHAAKASEPPKARGKSQKASEPESEPGSEPEE